MGQMTLKSSGFGKSRISSGFNFRKYQDVVVIVVHCCNEALMKAEAVFRLHLQSRDTTQDVQGFTDLGLAWGHAMTQFYSGLVILMKHFPIPMPRACSGKVGARISSTTQCVLIMLRSCRNKPRTQLGTDVLTSRRRVGQCLLQTPTQVLRNRCPKVMYVSP